ncbi:ion channel [Vibrio viridaestus]|uniref:Potassium transporter Kef n=1 Tax=Vibrio viridaestus TaxID=2487322 RepID=A0A3N9TDU1_9VIBR|nr:ion channel [Vibrio viridaestus]RQW62388.1 potassium transporter Kef [Vibrio viridaestus]
MSETKHCCRYVSPGGWRCDQEAHDSELCYWHNPDVDKSEDDVKSQVEEWARSGRPLDGFQLARTNLADINLVNAGSKAGYSCRDADFYRADLTHAHCFGLDLRGASLMKAKLVDANLNCTQVEGANFLGVDFSRARLENVGWGKYLKQEKLAREQLKARNITKARSLFQEAEEVCRNVRKQCEKQGLFETAGRFFKKEMRLRRYQMPFWSMNRAISRMVDLFCGYGEEPLRVVGFSMFLILSCACIYFALDTVPISQEWSKDNLVAFYAIEFLNAMYFSVVTFTTLGYGDISPVGIARFVAAAEAFLGSFMMALFVVVFVKKMTR